MAADGCIDAAHGIRQLGKQRFVQRLAHAVEALKLETLDAARVLDHAGDRERIVGGELRENPLTRGEELFHARHVAEIGHGLAREHWIVGKSTLLCAFDLGVPIRAFDQADGQAAAERGGRLLDPVDHRQCALLIGLHRKPETVPAARATDRAARRR